MKIMYLNSFYISIMHAACFVHVRKKTKKQRIFFDQMKGKNYLRQHIFVPSHNWRLYKIQFIKKKDK